MFEMSHFPGPYRSDFSLRPFRIAIPQSELDDLQNRLARTRWPAELPGAGRNYGVPPDRLKQLVEYWRTCYDWRKYEALLNSFPQFTTAIDGAKIHFLHVRSPEKKALPLVITHGWPGSIVEFLHIIGPLADPKSHGGDPADAFHLVIPSIPGFGFSGPVKEKGWNVGRIAHAWAELMRRLGYDRYGAQGGDWGSAISRALAAIDPEHVCGVHLNYLPTPPPPSADISDLTEEEKARIANTQRLREAPPGYMRLQSTRPQTISYALTDSPVGQLAWIAEKFIEWTDPSCPIAEEILLTNVMLYWLTGTAGSSALLYYENARSKGRFRPGAAPVGVAVFPHDIQLPVRRFAELQYTVVHWTEFDRGGHFAALEVPDLFVEDVRKFFRRFR
jgi:pimeloyl-ACP methyl ester carboxylesterase